MAVDRNDCFPRQLGFCNEFANCVRQGQCVFRLKKRAGNSSISTQIQQTSRADDFTAWSVIILPANHSKTFYMEENMFQTFWKFREYQIHFLA